MSYPEDGPMLWLLLMAGAFAPYFVIIPVMLWKWRK